MCYNYMIFSHSKFHLTNMKSIIAVIFLGTVTCAFAAYIPYMSEKCLDVTAMSNFQPERFFSGTWYVTHAKDGTKATICHKYITKNRTRWQV
uniref:Pc123, similar to Td23,salivary lipocalin n=1 Tax=Panstrongylus chinai TaxID=156444 RepID=A0A286P0W4_9HEMI|nr:Pc123, similar to Td23,salivary lipocalin [Panstrongylus chinai]